MEMCTRLLEGMGAFFMINGVGARSGEVHGCLRWERAD